MGKSGETTIEMQRTEITIMSHLQGDYISLTHMLKTKNGDFFISDWLRKRNKIKFQSIWERVHNPDFNYGESAIIRSQFQAPKVRFYLSLGQRPRNLKKTPIRAESPSH